MKTTLLDTVGAFGTSVWETEFFLMSFLKKDDIFNHSSSFIYIASSAVVLKNHCFSLAETKFPVRWTAPEGIMKQSYTSKSDVWSFGVLMFEILTFCQLPYAGECSRMPALCIDYRATR